MLIEPSIQPDLFPPSGVVPTTDAVQLSAGTLWRLKNPEKAKESQRKYREKNKAKISARRAAYWIKNRDRLKSAESAFKRRHYAANREKLLKKQKAYAEKNKARLAAKIRTPEYRAWSAAWQRRRRKNNPHHKAAGNLRRRINTILRSTGTELSTERLIGCSSAEFKRHIEGQFSPGMNWGNYGKFGWHVDHIKPCSHFDLTQKEQQAACFNFSNLRPLWWLDNLSKGNRT